MKNQKFLNKSTSKIIVKYMKVECSHLKFPKNHDIDKNNMIIDRQLIICAKIEVQYKSNLK